MRKSNGSVTADIFPHTEPANLTSEMSASLSSVHLELSFQASTEEELLIGKEL